MSALCLSPGVKDSAVLGYPALTSQNKELGGVMEITSRCAAIRHRQHFLETLRQTAAAKQSWQAHAELVRLVFRAYYIISIRLLLCYVGSFTVTLYD